MRHDKICNIIIDELLGIGCFKDENSLAVIAYLVENLIAHPKIELSYLMSEFAKRHRSNRTAVERIVDRGLNIYDPAVYAAITEYTSTKPLTAKDALCDLASKIRILHFTNDEQSDFK